jgi:hypothetical protein
LPARRTFGTTEERQADQARLAAEREARRKSGTVKPEDRSDTPYAASCGKSAGLAHAPVAGELVGRLLASARPADLSRRCCAVRGGWDLAKVHPGMAAVQLLVHELDDDLAHELGDGAAQLVSDERLERCPAGAATLGVYDAARRGNGGRDSEGPGVPSEPGPSLSPITNRTSR